MNRFLHAFLTLLFVSGVVAQSPRTDGLSPGALTLFHQPADAWPTYNGDYSGRR